MPTKHDAIVHSREIPADQNPLPLMRPIKYMTRGSRYGTCGIRIDGSPEFVDAVLSNLKPLLGGENQNTRLELSRNKVKTGFKELPNAQDDAECCYIRLHVRGRVGMGRKVKRPKKSAVQGFGPQFSFAD